MTGRVHSVQTLGTLDGPGVRYVLFLQGCPLRCGCCHNPDTWETTGGKEMTAAAVFAQVERYRPYFGANGGITISGGEALLQAEFAAEVFGLCKAAGIHTCLDTSGCMLTDSVKKLLSVTDLVLLDIKYTTDEKYRAYVGCGLQSVLDFLDYLAAQGIAAWLRQVVIAGKNDDAENLSALAKIAKSHANVEKTQLLAFRKLCQTKYDALQKPFAFGDIPETSADILRALQQKLNELM